MQAEKFNSEPFSLRLQSSLYSVDVGIWVIPPFARFLGRPFLEEVSMSRVHFGNLSAETLSFLNDSTSEKPSNLKKVDQKGQTRRVK